MTDSESQRGYALGEFLCPGCGGLADVIVQERPYGDGWHPAPDGSAPTVMWWAPWQAWVSIELVCQGPADAPELDDDDEAEAARAAALAALPPGASAAEMFVAVMSAAPTRPRDPAADAAWDHAGTAIDLIATDYQPISLN